MYKYNVQLSDNFIANFGLRVCGQELMQCNARLQSLFC